MTMKTAKDLVAEADRQIETLSANEAAKLIGGPGAVFVGVREGEEVQKTGQAQGAVHVPRGRLEFEADPKSPTHKPQPGGGKRLVLYCASGNRSALPAKALQDMRLDNVAHVAGGLGALRLSGAPAHGGAP
jgi:rhodanese-related sulfurtransferase